MVGAGIAGLAAANELHRAGFRVSVVDKGRNPGGRMSRKRSPTDATTGWDHGAQYFTVRDPGFARQVADWQRGGVVDEWCGRFVEVQGTAVVAAPTRQHWVGKPAMNAPARDLAARLPHGTVRCECRVERVVREGTGFRLLPSAATKAVDAWETSFDAVVVTAPAPQAAQLLEPETALCERLRQVQALPCVALMLGFDRPLDVPWDAARIQHHPVLSWVAREGSKPGRAPGERWVLHATHAWSGTHFEDQGSDAALLDAFASLTGTRTAPMVSVRHGWRFALVEQPLGEPWIGSADGRLVVAGDACLGARVEDAWRSGSVAGSRLATTLRS